MLPAKDVEAVQRWAHERTEPEVRDRLRVEVDIAPRSLTIVECSFMGYRDDWLRVPSARLGWVGRRGLWTLYRFKNEAAVRYEFCEPSANVQDLLNEIEADPTFIFWG